MRLPAPRTKTPAVEPIQAEEITQQEEAPPEKAAPVEARPASEAAVRSRKQTLVSPIPALLATKMGQIREERGDGTPLPVDRRSEQTSRFELPDDDYVVEVEPHK